MPQGNAQLADAEMRSSSAGRLFDDERLHSERISDEVSRKLKEIKSVKWRILCVFILFCHVQFRALDSGRVPSALIGPRSSADPPLVRAVSLHKPISTLTRASCSRMCCSNAF